MTEPIIGILTIWGDTHIITALIDANLRVNPREFSICDAYFESFATTFSFHVYGGSVSESVDKKKSHFLEFGIFSQIICLHKTAISMCSSSLSRCGPRIMLHSQNYFRFPRRRKTENGTGSELYQSCQAPSHHNSGPRIRLQPRLFWILVSGTRD